MSQEISHTDLLMEMLSIPALSRVEKERSDFLEGFLKDLGYDVSRTHHNLLLGMPEIEDDRPRILLNSHMDTVSPVDGWEGDPFSPLIEGEKIIGLGSNDAGASVVTLIAAYHKMKLKLESKMNLMLLISAEEEVSGDKGISAVLSQLGHLDGVIVGEPTGMQAAVAERGLMVIDAELKGKAGHAARSEGENAIYKAIKDLKTLAGLEFSENSKWLPKPGAQVTMISAGTNHNVVPDLCRFVVDVRSNDKYDNESMLKIIQSACMAEMTPRSTRLKPSSLDANHFLMLTISTCGLQPFGSSTLSDMALIPFPAVKMGPGDSSRSHTAGEFILRSELDKGVELYSHFLETMAEILEKQ